ncbi:unnamed protein product [Rhodiola kirilowii]
MECPCYIAHHNNHHEGFMNFMHRDEEVNYFPSRFDPVRHAKMYPIPSTFCTGKRERVSFFLNTDDFITQKGQNMYN